MDKASKAEKENLPPTQALGGPANGGLREGKGADCNLFSCRPLRNISWIPQEGKLVLSGTQLARNTRLLPEESSADNNLNLVDPICKDKHKQSGSARARDCARRLPKQDTVQLPDRRVTRGQAKAKATGAKGRACKEVPEVKSFLDYAQRKRKVDKPPEVAPRCSKDELFETVSDMQRKIKARLQKHLAKRAKQGRF